MEIKKQQENRLLNRTEITAEIVFEKSTPSRAEIKKQLAAELKTKADSVIISKIETAYGTQKALVYANIYKKPEDLKATEPEHLKKRNEEKKKEGEEKKEEAKPAEEKKEEKAKEKKEEAKPAEEKKEE